MDICSNLKLVKKRIQKACEKSGREPSEVTLIAVSKTKPLSYIKEALDCGQFAFGENRMQELEEKMNSFSGSEAEWHMIGNLQTNKIKHIAGNVNWVHSIEKLKYLQEFERLAEGNMIHALIQVNISGEKQKGGVSPAQLGELLKASQQFDSIIVCGLMGMATFSDNPEDVRDEFRLLKNLFDEHQIFNSGSVQLQHLSMGMSNDMEVAIEEGATMIRVGSDIFGTRNYN